VQIREATPDDVAAIRELEQKVPTAAHWGEDEYARLAAGDDKRHIVSVAEEAGLVQGFLVGSCAGPEWEIENVVVAEAARRCGTGRELVLDYIRRGRAGGADAIFLEVRRSSHHARKLYEKCGFVEIGCRKHYYNDPPDDAVVYKLSLAAAARSPAYE
jgi:ribosomal protein S18 acetylase RimI-like enzyme